MKASAWIESLLVCLLAFVPAHGEKVASALQERRNTNARQHKTLEEPTKALVAYPTAQEMIGIANETESLLNDFDKQSTNIDFYNWVRPNVLGKVYHQATESIRQGIRDVRGWFPEIKSKQKASSVQLFWLHNLVRQVGSVSNVVAEQEGQLISQYPGPISDYEGLAKKKLQLMQEISMLHARALTLLSKFDNLMLRQLQAEEADLVNCHAERK